MWGSVLLLICHCSINYHKYSVTAFEKCLIIDFTSVLDILYSLLTTQDGGVNGEEGDGKGEGSGRTEGGETGLYV